jgi:hypothetical protein
MKSSSISSVLVLMLSLATSALSGQREPLLPPNDVSFSISTEQKLYKVGEQITVHYRITNTSNGAVYAPREWEAKCAGRPHVWGWFEDSTGKHFVPGYAGSCSPSAAPRTVAERMGKEAVLLHPGQHLDGTFRLDTRLFGGLAPGKYRIEAVLYGWRDEEFTSAEGAELENMGGGFLRGELPASTSITLMP